VLLLAEVESPLVNEPVLLLESEVAVSPAVTKEEVVLLLVGSNEVGAVVVVSFCSKLSLRELSMLEDF